MVVGAPADNEGPRVSLLVVALLVLLGGIIGVTTYEDDATDESPVAAEGDDDLPPVPDTSDIDFETPNTIVNPAAPADPADGGAEPVPGAATSSTTAPAGGAAPTTAAPATTTTTASGVTPTGDPGPASLPAPGTYTYAVTNDDGDTTRTDTVTRLDGDRSSGTVRIEQTEDGEGLVNVVEGAADGFVVTETSVKSQFGDTDPCEWDPPWTFLGVLAPGATWADESTCETTISGATLVLDVSVTGAVVGTEVTSVLGTPREVWVIEYTLTQEADISFGVQQAEQDSTTTVRALFDPDLGAEVSSTSTIEATGQETFTATSSSTLTTYTPA